MDNPYPLGLDFMVRSKVAINMGKKILQMQNVVMPLVCNQVTINPCRNKEMKESMLERLLQQLSEEQVRRLVKLLQMCS